MPGNLIQAAALAFDANTLRELDVWLLGGFFFTFPQDMLLTSLGMGTKQLQNK